MHLKRFLLNRRGSAAVEFAFIAPLIVMFYYGLAETTQGLMADRRAGHVATAVGDIVAQEGTISTADVNDVFKIANTILKPLPSSALSIRITSIRIETDGKAKVVWSMGNGGTLSALAVGAVLSDVPATFIVPGTGVVRAETSYVYTSPIQEMMPQPITFDHATHLRPRAMVPVVKSD